MRLLRALLVVVMALPLGAGLLTAGTAGAESPPIILANHDGAGHNRPSLFRFLFGDRERRAAPPPRRAVPSQPQQRRAVRPSRQRPATRQARPSRPSPPDPSAEAQTVKAVEKAPDAKRVLVVGDFMARALAKGLGEAYAEDPSVLVIEATSGSSGLVRDDYYDWRTELPPIVEEQKPDAIVVMIGGNDRQAIRTDSGSAEHGTDAWNEAYGKRIAEFRDVLTATGKPVLWTGLVPVRSNSMSRDYSAFNGLYREKLQDQGVGFVDPWNGFADEQGGYVVSGPDVQGQVTRLRVDDGLNFTGAGQRKLAFFVESDLARILKDGAAARVARLPDDAAGTASGTPDDDEAENEAATAVEAAAPKIGPMLPLEAIDLPASAEARLSSAGRSAPGEIVEIVVAPGGNPQSGAPSPAGRADNFAWPASEAASAR
jgi:hypothetical protein